MPYLKKNHYHCLPAPAPVCRSRGRASANGYGVVQSSHAQIPLPNVHVGNEMHEILRLDHGAGGVEKGGKACKKYGGKCEK